MRTLIWAGLCAAGVLASAGSANAVAVVEYDGGVGHLTDPTNQMGFEAMPASLPGNTAYVEDGISITYVTSSGGTATPAFPDTGIGGWATGGLGDYTDIKMTNGSQIDEVQWDAQGANQTVIYFELLSQGQLIEPMNHFTAVGGPYRNFGLQGVGVTFDEIRLVAISESFNFDAFTPNEPSALQIDNLAIHALDPPGSAAPEPAAWALMLLGFGGLGAAARRSRRALA